MRIFVSALLFVALVACASSARNVMPMTEGTDGQQSSVNSLQPDESVHARPNVSVLIRSDKVVYEVNNKFYASSVNGSCAVHRVGRRAVGCIVGFIFHVTAHVQKGQIGLFTKRDAKGCLAAVSAVYKNFNVHNGEKLIIKKFYWTGKC